MTFFLPIAESEKFVDGLGFGIAPPREAGGAHHAIVVLLEDLARAAAVDFARRGDEQAATIPAGFFKDGFGAADVVDDGAHRVIDHELHAHGCGEMVDHIHVADQIADDFLVQGGVDDARQRRNVLNVFEASRAEVIQHKHLVALANQRLTQVRPDESCAACH